MGGEQRLDRPLSLSGEVTEGDVCEGESSAASIRTAESGLSGSGSEPLWLTLARFLAALLRRERREFSIWERVRKSGRERERQKETPFVNKY